MAGDRKPHPAHIGPPEVLVTSEGRQVLNDSLSEFRVPGFPVPRTVKYLGVAGEVA